MQSSLLWFSFTAALFLNIKNCSFCPLLISCRTTSVCMCVIHFLCNWPKACGRPPLLLVWGGSLLSPRVSPTICPCLLDECVGLCVHVCIVRAHFPLVCVVSAVEDEEKKEEGDMSNLREASREMKFLFKLPTSYLPSCCQNLNTCACLCDLSVVGGTCLIIPCHCFGGCCSWISHKPCKNNQLRQEKRLQSPLICSLYIF